MFVGPGQEMGRRFAAIDNRVLAYTADILSSLTPILYPILRIPTKNIAGRSVSDSH